MVAPCLCNGANMGTVGAAALLVFNYASDVLVRGGGVHDIRGAMGNLHQAGYAQMTKALAIAALLLCTPTSGNRRGRQGSPVRQV